MTKEGDSYPINEKMMYNIIEDKNLYKKIKEDNNIKCSKISVTEAFNKANNPNYPGLIDFFGNQKTPALPKKNPIKLEKPRKTEAQRLTEENDRLRREASTATTQA